VIAPKFDQAYSFGGHYATVCMKSASGAKQWGIIDRAGRWVIPPKYSWVMVVGKNRAIASKTFEGFSKEEWAKNPNERSRLFVQLLREYNLIGMPESQLKELLGEGSELKNDIAVPAGIVKRFDHNGIQFGIDKDGKIQAWRIGGDRPGHWQMENVVILNRFGSDLPGNVVPKEQNAS
jgi:hypothetical protein